MESEKIFRRVDFWLSLLVGFLVGFFILPILPNIGISLGGVRFISPILFAILAPLGLWIASYLARILPFLWQAAKFVLVGSLNTFIDLGILNLLIALTGVAAGSGYIVFKIISFSIAVTNSYFWNKFWTFRATGIIEPGREFMKFLTVSIGALILNAGTAYVVVNVVGAPGGIDPKLWANVGAICAVAVSFIGNFLGYKFLVFKK